MESCPGRIGEEVEEKRFKNDRECRTGCSRHVDMNATAPRPGCQNSSG